ncbi:hypothetical protein PSACC_01953, isoform A [Paramicrosporidium saccamoebae]|uniref:Hydroxymethylglutaryl-CoA synthase n=1 Tax=Paramicrosporidium saccamoebae TaxID=1246581 RepID=A0A2H9TKL4_9FUNG|nr:hypothetical protein PSACC_01953, isoform A [Paramicrosporidium saccamoebae]
MTKQQVDYPLDTPPKGHCLDMGFWSCFGLRDNQAQAERSMTKSPVPNIGILAAEIYLPNTYVSQAALGTVGHGGAVSLLMERHEISEDRIGRIEVGTETIQDKSKSVKSYLMQLFPLNPDICGVDNVTACYGGTAALLNSVAWMESEDWDGRLALVVVGDIAVYAKGPARPTGGAAAMAILIGPNAPLVMERGTAAHFMQHAFDFYKPDPSSEYPTVDGQTSIFCYLGALDACYNAHLDKIEKKTGAEVNGLELFDHFVFHAPYAKLVQKSVGRLLFNDFLRCPNPHSQLEPFRDAVIETTYNNRELDTLLSTLSKESFATKTAITKLLPGQLGNSYCACLFSGLFSLICQLKDTDCVGRRIGMFSYGSGLAATMFSLKVVAPMTNVTPPVDEIKTILSKRQEVSAAEFEAILNEREANYCRKGWSPQSSTEVLRSGTFYLDTIDAKFRRFYNRKN